MMGFSGRCFIFIGVVDGYRVRDESGLTVTTNRDDIGELKKSLDDLVAAPLYHLSDNIFELLQRCS